MPNIFRKIIFLLFKVFSVPKIYSLYSVWAPFLDTNKQNFKRLERPETFAGMGRNYSKAVLGSIDSGVINRILKRNRASLSKRRKFIKKKKKLNGKALNVFMATRSWHFFEPLYIALSKDKNIYPYRFDTSRFDNKNTQLLGSKVRYFRNLSLSLLKLPDEIRNEQASLFKEFLSYPDQENCRNSLASADVVLIDWLNHNTLWGVSCLPPNKKIVVRVHSYEVFSFYALLLDYGRIDGLIFISQAIHDIFMELWGWLLPSDMKILIAQNIRDPYRLQPSKQPQNFTNVPRNKVLGMVQYNREVKDPEFALKVFDCLLELDSEFQLLLVGDPLSKGDTENVKSLAAKLSKYKDGAVKELGYLNNVNDFYQSAGFVLSTSLREGSHESVIEGMRLGCVPVIRNWPLLAPFKGAQKAFPNQKIFDSPKEMAMHIHKISQSSDYEEASLKSKHDSAIFFDPQTPENYIKFLKEIV